MLDRYSMMVKNKGFTLIELLVVVAIIGILAAVGVVAYGKYTTSAKIAASKEQHYSMKKFIEASYGQCALGDNYVLMNTCKLNNWSCNGLRVGNSNPGTVKRPCKSGAGSASNSAYHFVFHFNNSGFKNPYNLDGPTMLSIGGTDPKQCCLAQGFNPRILGQTYVWGYNNDNRIKVVTNIGDTSGNNAYLTDYVTWPGRGF
ncbi:type II secretion system protein [Candidatus Pelagibacter sp.]|nr:type II secretion system protein [Candidatus Pelagibacter sp.]